MENNPSRSPNQIYHVHRSGQNLKERTENFEEIVKGTQDLKIE